MSKTVYISGPMTGIEAHNKPLFLEVGQKWKDAGWTVHNPAEEVEGYTEATRPDFLRRDFQMVMDSDAIAVLPGWEKSAGACGEVHIAELLRLPVLDAMTFQPWVKPKDERTILQRADLIINGPRNEAYGDPRPNHERIARFWSDYLGVEISWKQAVHMMILLKVARLMQTPDHEDSIQDIIGYAALFDLQNRRDSEPQKGSE